MPSVKIKVKKVFTNNGGWRKVMADDNTAYNINPKSNFVVEEGGVYNVMFTTKVNGKYTNHYVNEIVPDGDLVTDKPRKKEKVVKEEYKMTKEDWARKNKAMAKMNAETNAAAFVQAVARVMATGKNTKDVDQVVEELSKVRVDKYTEILMEVTGEKPEVNL